MFLSGVSTKLNTARHAVACVSPLRCVRCLRCVGRKPRSVGPVLILRTLYAHVLRVWSVSICLRCCCYVVVERLSLSRIGVASYGALGHMPPPLDFQPVINPPPAKILTEQIWKMYKNNAIFAQFLSIFGPFSLFICHSFPQGVIIVPKMRERSPINFNSTRTSDCGKTGS